MWWSYFSWDYKGPFYIWEKQTPEEKKAMIADLKARNAKRYEDDKLKQELENAINKIHITRNQPGPRAQFKHNEDTGAYVVKEGKGGINWYQARLKFLANRYNINTKSYQLVLQGLIPNRF